MNTVDKADVDISKLFIWRKQVTIVDESDKEKLKVWIRVVGDADLNRARTYAIRCSAEMRKALKDEDNELRYTYIPDYSDLDKTTLIRLVMVASTTKLTREAMAEVDIPYPKEPQSEDDLEALEQFQKEVDEWPEKKNAAIRELLTTYLTELEQRLQSLEIEDLIKEHTRLTIADVCENEMIRKFREMCTFFSLYKDKELKKRLFQSFSEFEDLPEFYKNQFITAYDNIEIGSDELKK